MQRGLRAKVNPVLQVASPARRGLAGPLAHDNGVACGEREAIVYRARVERHRQAETDIRRQGRREDDRRRQGVLRQQETAASSQNAYIYIYSYCL